MVGAVSSAINEYARLGASLKAPQQANKVFDFDAAKKKADDYAASFKKSSEGAHALRAESTDFLKEYTVGLNALKSAAETLSKEGVGAFRDLVDGNGADGVVAAAKKLADEYNNSLKTMNDNAGRGRGVEQQLARMVDDLASTKTMETAGISVNKDGTLSLDEEKLAAALSSKNTDVRDTAASALREVAVAAREDARAGLQASSFSLVENDLASIRSAAASEQDPITQMANSARGGGAYALSNQMAVGVLMNMAV